MQAYPRLYIGYANGVWYTPLGTYGLPIVASNLNVALLANFSFTQTTSGIADKAACIGIMLRNDYNQLTHTFSNASLNPMLEIEVCLWWSPTLVRNGKFQSVSDGINTYDLLNQTVHSFNGLSNWTTYIFGASASILTYTNINILAFSQFIHTSILPLNNYIICGVYFGFRVYTGIGSFTYASVPQLTFVNAPMSPLHIITNPPLSSPDIACILASYDSNSSNCKLSDTGWLLYNIVLQIVSTPNAALLLRLSPFVLVIDEFSYYAYHQANYDRGFKFLVDLCWKFNNQKWVPSPLKPSYDSISDVFSSISVMDWAKITPSRFQRLNQNIYFLNNANDFLFLTIPLTASTFIMGWLLSKKLTCWKFQIILRPFSVFSYLLVSLFAENVQYLTFRAFQQLRFIVPRSKLEILSIALSIVLLLLVVVSSTSLYILIWAFRVKQFEAENNKWILQSFIFLNITTTSKFLNGLTHAYIDNPLIQSCCLVLINLLMLLVTFIYFSTFKIKRSLCLCSFIQIAKVLLSVTLLIEVCEELDLNTISVRQVVLGRVVSIFSYTLICLIILHYVSIGPWSFLTQLATKQSNRSHTSRLKSIAECKVDRNMNSPITKVGDQCQQQAKTLKHSRLARRKSLIRKQILKFIKPSSPQNILEINYSRRV